MTLPQTGWEIYLVQVNQSNVIFETDASDRAINPWSTI